MTPVNLDSKKEKKRKEKPRILKSNLTAKRSHTWKILNAVSWRGFQGSIFILTLINHSVQQQKKHPKSQSQELLWKNKLSSSQTDWPQVCMEKSHHNGRCLHSLAKVRQWPKNRSTWEEQRQHNTSCLWIGATSPWCLNTWNVLSEGNVDCVTANEIHQSMLL